MTEKFRDETISDLLHGQDPVSSTTDIGPIVRGSHSSSGIQINPFVPSTITCIGINGRSPTFSSSTGGGTITVPSCDERFGSKMVGNSTSA